MMLPRRFLPSGFVICNLVGPVVGFNKAATLGQDIELLV